MKIAFNPSTVAALIAPPNNKDITFDLRGHNIFARGVKFCGTDTNTWRDIKINNVSIDSNILDLRDGDNTTLTNINGVVTINSTWRPVVDNLTSDSTTSSLSANQGRVLAGLINSKSDSGHNHDDRYLRLTGGTMAGNALITFADSGSWGTDEGPQGARGGLYWTGQSDYAKLYAEEIARDNLDLVIQFGDDNSNGLSIRNKDNTQTSYISAGGVITTGTFKGNLDWSYITNKPATVTRWPSWDEITNKPNTFTPSGLLTSVTNSNNGISITVGGTTKSVSNISVNYASSAGNADTVDWYHATDGRTFTGNINWSPNWNDTWSDGTHTHPWYGFDHRYPNTGAYSTTLTDHFGMTIKTANTLRLDFGTLLLNGTDIHNINVASATKLQTARNIWGQRFDGTGNVSGSLSGVGHIQFSADNSYSIGTTTSEAAHTYTRQVWARHLNASRVYAGDTNLYIGYSNTAQVKFFSGTKQSGDGSNERMTISTNGNVGIGTTSPAYKLHVAGDIYSSATIRSKGQNKAIILSNDAGPAWISALEGQVIFNTGHAIRFGETAWDWNQWAGLKYTHSNKTIYLGIADNSIFNANSAQGGGTLNLRAGISSIHLNSGTSIIGLPTNGSPYSSRVTLNDTSIYLSAYGDIFMSTGSGAIELISGYSGIKLSCQGNNASIDSRGFKVEAFRGVYLNSGNSGNVYLCSGGGKVGIGTGSPQTALDIRSSEIAPLSVNGAIKLATNPNGTYYYQPICVAIGKIKNTQTEYETYCNANITFESGRLNSIYYVRIVFNDITAHSNEIGDYILFITNFNTENNNVPYFSTYQNKLELIIDNSGSPSFNVNFIIYKCKEGLTKHTAKIY